ncbi:MAG: carbon-nitrogen hydrolase family protein [Acidobacteriota bacterium]|jgi:predicted amidohydrolase
MLTDRSLAAAQTVPVRGDVEANLGQHTRLVEAAAGLGIDLLVFPELSLTGYELDLAEELAFVEEDSRLAPLVDLASTHGITLVVGAPVRLGTGLHIGAFILYPDRTRDVYTKQHLGAFPSDARPDGPVPPAEATVFRPGDRRPLVRLAGDRTAAVAICADAGRPAHAAEAADRGASIYLASMFVLPADLAAETARLRGYAARHGMTVVLANHGGPTGGLAGGGGSRIWSRTGQRLAMLEGPGAGLAFAVGEAPGTNAGQLRL